MGIWDGMGLLDFRNLCNGKCEELRKGGSLGKID